MLETGNVRGLENLLQIERCFARAGSYGCRLYPGLLMIICYASTDCVPLQLMPALAATVSFYLWRQHWKHCGQNSTTCRCHWNSCFLRMSVVGRWSDVCAALLAKVLWIGVPSSFLILPRHVWPTKLQVYVVGFLEDVAADREHTVCFFAKRQ